MNKINTLHILPGPIYDAESLLKKRYEGFSSFCSGALVSTSNTDQDYQFGDFQVRLRRPHPRNSLTLFLSILKNSLIMARKIKGIQLVVSYDPLKTGMIGLAIKYLFKCQLIVEVNGVYGDKNLYANLGLLNRVKRYLYTTIQNFVLSHADGVKGLFPAQLDGLSLNPSANISIFSNYTDIDAKPPSSVTNKSILSIGFPLHIKGLDILIAAFKQLDVNDWTLTLLGHFNKDESDKLTKLIKGDERISLAPPVNFSDIPSRIDSADILVLASRSEAMGRVLLESAARGKARIGSRVGGIPTVINDGVDGYLFESENVDELADKLKLLIHSDKERFRVASNAYERFNTDFNHENYLNRCKKFYQAVLDKPSIDDH